MNWPVSESYSSNILDTENVEMIFSRFESFEPIKTPAVEEMRKINKNRLYINFIIMYKLNGMARKYSEKNRELNCAANKLNVKMTFSRLNRCLGV